MIHHHHNLFNRKKKMTKSSLKAMVENIHIFLVLQTKIIKSVYVIINYRIDFFKHIPITLKQNWAFALTHTPLFTERGTVITGCGRIKCNLLKTATAPSKTRVT